MAINRLLSAVAFALVLLTVLASEKVANEEKEPTNNDKRLPIEEASAKDEPRNGTQVNLDYSISVTMVNYGDTSAKVQQRYLFPNGVEVRTFTLQKDSGYRAKRSADNQKLTQWAGVTVDLKPSDVKEADMTYINHPEQVINPNSKTFHKLSTAIMIKEGDLLGGKISSPNYPYSYPNGADLTWLIVYPQDNIVKLEMEDYATEECCDRVIVYDGYNKSQYPLATFEGDYSYSNNVVFTSQSAMFIRFTSDCLTTNRGFRASYINQQKSKAPSMSCGYVHQINGNEGYIESPNYPGTYDEFMNCTWQVQTYYNTRVKFVFYNFTIGSDDHIFIYEGNPSNPGNRIASLNGNNLYYGYTVYASSNEAFVIFTSGYSSYYADMFVISYTGVSDMQTTTTEPMSCGQVQNTGGDSGYFTSPNYPGTYDANMNCTWAVQTYYNTRVKFDLEYFYIGNDDQVSFYDGLPNNPGSHIRTLSGSYGNGYKVYASSNQAFAVFISGYYAYSYNKFNISYDGEYETPVATTDSYYEQSTAALYYDPPQCNGTGSSSMYGHGDIYSPGYNTPGYYPLSDTCIWYVTTYSYYDAIRFYPYYFSTEYNYDFVQIYNGHGTSQSNLISQISGYVDYGTTLALTDSIYATVTFNSDYIINDRGFKIRFYGLSNADYTTAQPVETTPTGESTTCPYPYISGASGEFHSPYYPYAYHNNMNCTQWLTTPYGSMVRLTVESFWLGSGDYFKIYNGYTGEFLKSMTNYYSPGYQYQAPTNYIMLIFTSNSVSSSSSYTFSYEGYFDPSFVTTVAPTAQACGGSTPYNYGVITSPYYPSSYINDLDCVWTVTVYSNMNVLFTVAYFNTESCCDRLIFYGGTPSNPLGPLETLSGYVSQGYEIKIPDDQAWISFHSDYSVTSKGFNITYQPVTTDYIPNSHPGTDGYDVVTQGYNDTTQWVRSGVVEAENGPTILGRDLWGDKQKPAHLRREKLKKEDEVQDNIN